RTRTLGPRSARVPISPTRNAPNLWRECNRDDDDESSQIAQTAFCGQRAALRLIAVRLHSLVAGGRRRRFSPTLGRNRGGVDVVGGGWVDLSQYRGRLFVAPLKSSTLRHHRNQINRLLAAVQLRPAGGRHQ